MAIAIRWSKTQVDKLGKRLKEKSATSDDLTALNDCRLSFHAAFQDVLATIHDRLDLSPSGRPAKSTTAIVEKLLRTNLSLTKIQDIAGCRLIVANLLAQDTLVEHLAALFDVTTMVDRRVSPSSGYRAVHVVVESGDKTVEIQVRTELQQRWAEASEKLSDRFGQALKYGRGTPLAQNLLLDAAATVFDFECAERELQAELVSIEASLGGVPGVNKLRQRAGALREKMQEVRTRTFDMLDDVKRFELTRVEGTDDVSH